MRLIDIEDIDYVRLEDSLHCLEHHKGDEVECVICAPTVEAIPKDQYEARLKENNELINDLEELRTMINKFAESYETRLKADLVAMLTEIQLEIEELKSYESADGQDLVMLADIGILFQQKINKLKEVKDGTN